jgi:glutathione-specific gamma-glutamylcyclotransferase
MTRATGIFGSNAEYLFKLHAALDECALRDEYIDRLVKEMERLSMQATCGVSGEREQN